jgi:SurA N-terminal domain
VKVRFVVASVLSLVVLAGCSSKPQLAGAAAVVGDTQISQSKVTGIVKTALVEIKATPPTSGVQAPTAAQLGTMVVDRLVASEVLHQIAKNQPTIAVTPKQVDAFTQQIFSQYGEPTVANQLLFQSGIPSAEIKNFVEDYMLKQSIVHTIAPTANQNEQSTALYQFLGAEAKKLGVRVSPRYGNWDLASSQAIAGDNTLSFPAAPAN